MNKDEFVSKVNSKISECIDLAEMYVYSRIVDKHKNSHENHMPFQVFNVAENEIYTKNYQSGGINQFEFAKYIVEKAIDGLIAQNLINMVIKIPTEQESVANGFYKTKNRYQFKEIK